MKKNTVRVLALVLVALMCLSLIPLAAHAEAHVHEMATDHQDPTCVEVGFDQTYCPICNTTFSMNYIPATGVHSFIPVEDEEYMIEEGDCTHPYQYWKSCSVCKQSAEEAYGLAVDKLVEELNARKQSGEQADWETVTKDRILLLDERYKFSAGGEGHHIIRVDHQEATCTSDGWKDYTYCDVCGEYFNYEAIPAKGHRWTEFKVTKAPTCTEAGSQERVCEVCDQKDIQVIPALGHTWTAFKVTKAATCTEDGSQERTCTVCGEKEIQVIPAAHKWGEFVVIEEPTCVATGTKEHTCTVCNHKETESIPAAHKWGEFVVTKEPTCYSTGEKQRVCSECGETEVEWIDMAHKYENGVCVYCGEAQPEGTQNVSETAAFQSEEAVEEPAVEATEPAEEAAVLDNAIYISFDGNGATSGSMEAQAFEPGVEQNLYLNTFERTGYKFIGWDYMADGSGWGDDHLLPDGWPITIDPEAPAEDMTLYAQWAEDPEAVEEKTETLEVDETATFGAGDGPFTVTFEANGGSFQSGAFNADDWKNRTNGDGGIDNLPGIGSILRAGHTLMGWNTDRDGNGVHYDPGAKYSFYDDVILYAEWDVRISYMKNGIDVTGGPMQSTPVNPGENITLAKNVFEREDYSFNGWNTEADGSGISYTDEQQFTAPNKDLDLYAQWAKNIVTVTFDPNGGEGSINPVEINWGEEKVLPKNEDQITYGDYAFLMWNTKNDGSGTDYPDGATILAKTFTKDAVLYAQWSKTTFTVTYNANGGTLPEGKEMGPDQIDTSFESSLTLTKNVFEKADNKFTGWNTKPDGTGTSYTDEQVIPATSFTANLVLYAQWKNSIVTVKFDANGGTLPEGKTMDPQHINTSTESSLPLQENTFERKGYKFTGWNTKGDGSGTAYVDKAQIPVSALTADITLYAQWEQTTFIVQFNGNGGSPSAEDPMIDQTIDKTDPSQTSLTLKKNTFTKVKSVFTGWNTASDGSGTAYKDGQKIKASAFTKNLYLYAQWMTAIVFDGNGATGGSMDMQEISITSPPSTVLLNGNTFTRTNYTFDKWTENADGSGQSWADQGDYYADTSRTLYAQWVKTSFSVNYDKNGGGGEPMTPNTISKNTSGIVKENAYIAPNTAKIFGEWNTKPDGSGESFQPGDTIESDDVPTDITLYAIWREKLDIWFYPGDDATGTTTIEEAPKDSVVTLPAPGDLDFKAHSGKTFAGWSLGDGTTLYKAGQKVVFGDKDDVKDGVVYTTARSVYANWADTIKISYHPNGGTVTTSAGTKSDAAVFSAPKDTPFALYTAEQLRLNRDGYEFKGWAMTASSKETRYADGETVTFSSDTTLYAVWEQHIFTGVVTISGSVSISEDIGFVGETLTANVTGEKLFTNYSYKWLRDGTAITGATSETYVPTAADFGCVITCEVTAEDALADKTRSSINYKFISIEESDKNIVNNGQTETDYVYGVYPGMYYSINNGAKQQVSLTNGVFTVTQQGIYRFYKDASSNVPIAVVNVVNWWTVGYNLSTSTGSDSSGSGTVTFKRGSTTLSSSTTIRDSAGNVILQPYSLSGYTNVWIVRQDAGITDITMTVKPSSGSYGHVSLNNGSYDSSNAERTYNLGSITQPMLYTVVFNKSSSSPRTGDMSHLGVWSALCLTSFVGAATILGSARKRKKNQA